MDAGSPENSGASATEELARGVGVERLDSAERHSFDLVAASDVLYEEHHARLLPLVLQTWLRPGGVWCIALAIRDADMMVRFVDGLHAAGLMEPAVREVAIGSDLGSGLLVMYGRPRSQSGSQTLILLLQLKVHRVFGLLAVQFSTFRCQIEFEYLVESSSSSHSSVFCCAASVPL